MCSNCNNMNSFNNPNLINNGIGMVVDSGNTLIPQNLNAYNNETLANNIETGCFNNNSCNYNNSCNCNCSCDCNSNASCGCNMNNTCGCNGNNTSIANDNNTTNDTLTNNLRNYIGRKITVELNNCGNNSKKTGVLTCVGSNFITLRSLNNNNCLLIDTVGLNFVTVHPIC